MLGGMLGMGLGITLALIGPRRGLMPGTDL
jgi:hypothetical protein